MPVAAGRASAVRMATRAFRIVNLLSNWVHQQLRYFKYNCQRRSGNSVEHTRRRAIALTTLSQTLLPWYGRLRAAVSALPAPQERIPRGERHPLRFVPPGRDRSMRGACQRSRRPRPPPTRTASICTLGGIPLPKTAPPSSIVLPTNCPIRNRFAHRPPVERPSRQRRGKLLAYRLVHRGTLRPAARATAYSACVPSKGPRHAPPPGDRPPQSEVAGG